MPTLNKVCLIGHLGSEPEVRYMTNGDPVCNFSIATTESWKDKASGEKKEKTEWHRITMFSKLAEIAEKYLHKGDLVYIEGKIETKEYIDKAGEKRYSTGINANTLQMLKTRRDNNPNGQVDDDPYASQSSTKPPAKKPAPATEAPSGGSTGFDDINDDIPFLFNENLYDCGSICSPFSIRGRNRVGRKAMQRLWVNQA